MKWVRVKTWTPIIGAAIYPRQGKVYLDFWHWMVVVDYPVKGKVWETWEENSNECG